MVGAKLSDLRKKTKRALKKQKIHSTHCLSMPRNCLRWSKSVIDRSSAIERLGLPVRLARNAAPHAEPKINIGVKAIFLLDATTSSPTTRTGFFRIRRHPRWPLPNSVLARTPATFPAAPVGPCYFFGFCFKPTGRSVYVGSPNLGCSASAGTATGWSTVEPKKRSNKEA